MTEQLEQAGRLLSVTDPVEAELEVAAIISTARVEGLSRELSDMFVASTVELARDHPSPRAAALLRTIAAIGSPPQRRSAINALGVVIDAGHYPPEWTAQLGQAVPGQAWRSRDVFGDTEIIAVTFRYGDAEHAVVVQVDLCREPVAVNVGVTAAVADLLRIIQNRDDPLVRVEPLDLEDVRHRIEAPLARCDRGEHCELSGSSVSCLPVARARIRRLPVGNRRPGTATFDAADRNAAVADFLGSVHAAETGEEEIVRFWAEVLTGYSGGVPGDAPTRVGPRKMSEMLLSYVPNTFALTTTQRDGMADVVTAWTRWSAARQGLDEVAIAHLEEHLPKVFAKFDDAYDDPDNILVRGYLTDLSTATADAAVLGAALARRHLAVPVPEARTGDASIRRLDAADPGHRRTIIEDEYRECAVPAGMTRTQFLAAAVHVAGQLWSDDPPEIWQAAQGRSAAGIANHDIVHELIVGSSA